MFKITKNPAYGSGRFRRAIRLTGSTGRVTGELEDDCHGFRVNLRHDGVRVTEISGQALRIPMTTCSGASEPLKALTGIPIDTDASAIVSQVDPRANCTHMYDLAVLAIAHANRGTCVRRYDVTVEDDCGDGSELIVRRDGDVIHHWLAKDYAIAEPAEFAGNPLMQGFAAWATKHYSGEEREAAFVGQKGFFVSRAREYDMNDLSGHEARDVPHQKGACYSYSAPQVDVAVRLATVRDFSDTPERLLQFVDAMS